MADSSHDAQRGSAGRLLGPHLALFAAIQLLVLAFALSELTSLRRAWLYLIPGALLCALAGARWGREPRTRRFAAAFAAVLLAAALVGAGLCVCVVVYFAFIHPIN